MATVATTLRFEDTDKAEATNILKSMGLTFNGYLNLSVKQLLNQRRIPFEIVPSSYEPTEETRRAMVAAEAKELGLIPDDAASFSSSADAMAWLNEE